MLFRSAVVAGSLTPAPRLHPELLAEERGEDLGLLGAETGQPTDPDDEVGAGRCLGPHRAGIRVEPVDQDSNQLLHPLRHCRRESVQRGRSPETRPTGPISPVNPIDLSTPTEKGPAEGESVVPSTLRPGKE